MTSSSLTFTKTRNLNIVELLLYISSSQKLTNCPFTYLQLLIRRVLLCFAPLLILFLAAAAAMLVLVTYIEWDDVVHERFNQKLDNILLTGKLSFKLTNIICMIHGPIQTELKKIFVSLYSLSYKVFFSIMAQTGMGVVLAYRYRNRCFISLLNKPTNKDFMVTLCV